MSRQEKMQEQFFSCYICFDVFKEPKTLTCLHRFCERCLHNYIVGISTAAARHQGFPCPVCREVIKAPDPRRPPSDWAALLKTDFHLKDLIKYVESRSELSPASKQPKIEHPCHVHKEKDCDIYCVDCCTAVCHLCAGVDHRGCNQVMTLAEVAEDCRLSFDLEFNKLSAQLEEEDTRIKMIKKNCMSHLEQQQAQVEAEIQTWGQSVRDLVSQEERKLSEQLKSMCASFHEKATVGVTKMEKSLDKRKDNIKRLSSSAKSASDFNFMADKSILELRKEFEGINTNLEQFRDLLQRISQGKLHFQKDNITSISFGSIVYTDVQTDSCSNSTIEVTQNSAEENKDSTSKKTIIALQKSITLIREQTLHKSETASRMHGSRDVAPPLTLKPSHLCKNYRGRSDSTLEATKTSVNTDAHMTQTGNARETDGHQSVILLRTVNCRFREDTMPPQLRDLIVVGLDATVMVTDWANQCVKAFHARRERDTRLSLGGKPWAITQLSETLAAVSLPTCKQICVLKIKPSLTVQNSFIAAKNYSGLATLNNSMLVASGGSDPPSVDIINLFGEVLKSFSLDSHGNPVFQYPSYICTTPGLLILVSDRKLGAVISVSHKGESKSSYWSESSQSLQKPSGIASDKSGRIFVAESRGLLTYSSDGQTGRALVKASDGILDDPRGVALDSEGLVYVISHDDEVKVLKIV